MEYDLFIFCKMSITFAIWAYFVRDHEKLLVLGAGGGWGEGVGVSQEELSFIASNQQIYAFYKWVIFEKKRHCGK